METAGTDPRAGTLHLSGMQMFRMEITDSLTQGIRDDTEFRWVNGICLECDFKERDSAAKVTEWNDDWPSWKH